MQKTDRKNTTRCCRLNDCAVPAWWDKQPKPTLPLSCVSDHANTTGESVPCVYPKFCQRLSGPPTCIRRSTQHHDCVFRQFGRSSAIHSFVGKSRRTEQAQRNQRVPQRTTDVVVRSPPVWWCCVECSTRNDVNSGQKHKTHGTNMLQTCYKHINMSIFDWPPCAKFLYLFDFVMIQ